MALFSTLLTLGKWGFKLIKPFISKGKESINIVDTATALFEKRTTPLTKYVFILTLGYLSVEQREALSMLISLFMENASSKDKILVALAVSIVLLFLRDILLSPYDSLKIAIRLFVKLVKKIMHLSLGFLLFAFSKKVRKSTFVKISQWWEYSVKVKELETKKQQIKTKSLDEELKTIKQRLKTFKKDD